MLNISNANKLYDRLIINLYCQFSLSLSGVEKKRIRYADLYLHISNICIVRHTKKQIYSDVWYEEEKKRFVQYLVSDVIQYAYRKWEASRHLRRPARIISKSPDSDLRCQNVRFVRLSSWRIIRLTASECSAIFRSRFREWRRNTRLAGSRGANAGRWRVPTGAY